MSRLNGHESERWGEHRLLALFFDLPIFHKILISNTLVVALGAWAAMALLRAHGGDQVGGEMLVAILGGILVSAIGVNYLLLRLALSPLVDLRNTVEEVLLGHLSARVSVPLFGDPGINRLAGAFNRMLDRIEVYTRTIEKERAHSGRLAGLILSSQEDERKRIARELHDETSQILATLMMGLGTVHRHIPKDGIPGHENCGGCRTRVEQLMLITDQTIEKVHRLAFNLRPSILDDLGLAQAVRWLVRECLDHAGLRTEVQAEGIEERLKPEVEIAAFRIIQEACTNILKYAGAKNVRIFLAIEGGSLHLAVEDDGVGFELDEVQNRERERHLGLFGMQERANLLGGNVEIVTAPGAGTIVRAIIPDTPGPDTTGDGDRDPRGAERWAEVTS